MIRESLAVSGRSGTGSGRTGALARKTDRLLNEADSITAVLDGLTAGPAVLRLRHPESLAQMALELEDTPDLDPIDEGDLTVRLRPDFECAPVSDHHTVNALKDDLDAAFEHVLGELIGPAPADGVTSEAYEELVGVTHGHVVNWLQREVRKRLS